MKSHTEPNSEHHLALIRQIVAIWPKPGGGEPADYEEQLAPYLAADFDHVDLLNKVIEVSRIVECETKEDHVVMQFFDSDDCLHRATFTRHGTQWKLKSLKFQCPFCFGTGENDGHCCSSCGRSGWGVS
jgi:hypothetical protein